MSRVAMLLGGLALLAGCEEPPPPPSYPVLFVASADPGEPLGGVRVRAGDVELVTDALGILSAELRGPEGIAVPLEVTCPAGHRLEAAPAPIVLRRAVDLTTGRSAALRVSIVCPPTVRHGIVVVRASGEGTREGIPVRIDGTEVARTDRSGVAHVAWSGAPGATFRVELATSAVMPALRPIDPVMPFSFGDEDELFVFDRELVTEAPPPRARVRRRRAAPVAAPAHRPPERL